jgi:hypothetical protein
VGICKMTKILFLICGALITPLAVVKAQDSGNSSEETTEQHSGMSSEATTAYLVNHIDSGGGLTGGSYRFPERADGKVITGRLSYRCNSIEGGVQIHTRDESQITSSDGYDRRPVSNERFRSNIHFKNILGLEIRPTDSPKLPPTYSLTINHRTSSGPDDLVVEFRDQKEATRVANAFIHAAALVGVTVTLNPFD